MVFLIIICFSSSSIKAKKKFWGVPHLLHMYVTFSFSVHVNVSKLYKSIKHLYVFLFRNSKNRITLSQCLIEKSQVQIIV